MGILHGVIDGIPAFRWYDRAHDRVLVANKPADAAVIEANLSTGKGLLVDDGVSISNLFTGDAPTAVLTMSRRARGGEATRQAVAQFVMSPSGLTRALSRSVSELTRDRFQTRRAIRRDVQPRCERNWETALLRCVTNGALRDLNTILVAQHMLNGIRSIYVDYVDYDEIAHHAGILRPESLEALEAVDGVLHQLELVASASPAEVPVRDPLRPRAVPGRDLRRPVRRGPGRAGRAPGRRATSRRPTTTSRAGAAPGHSSTSSPPPTASAAAPCSRPRTRWTRATATSPTRSRRHPAPRRQDRGQTGHGRRDLPRVRVRQPRADLRARREAAADASRPVRPLPGARRRPGRPPRCRLRRRDGRRRPGRAGQPWLAPARRRSRRGRRSAAAVRAVRTRVRASASPTAPRLPTSTSTACSTPAPTRSPPSRAWSAATAASAAGRTEPAPSYPSTCPSRGARGRGRRHARRPARHPAPPRAPPRHHRARRGVSSDNGRRRRLRWSRDSRHGVGRPATRCGEGTSTDPVSRGDCGRSLSTMQLAAMPDVLLTLNAEAGPVVTHKPGSDLRFHS